MGRRAVPEIVTDDTQDQYFERGIDPKCIGCVEKGVPNCRNDNCGHRCIIYINDTPEAYEEYVTLRTKVKLGLYESGEEEL